MMKLKILFAIGVIISAGVLFPPQLPAQKTVGSPELDPRTRDFNVHAQKNCDKLFALGTFLEKRVWIVDLGADKGFRGTCEAGGVNYYTDEGVYASSTIHDMKMAVHDIDFALYSDPKSAQDASLNILDNPVISGHPSSVFRKEEVTKKDTPDGPVLILNTVYASYLSDIPQTISTVNASMVRGNCYVSVTGSSFVTAAWEKYHWYDKESKKYIDLHPGFNHNIETELIDLTQKKTKEIINSLDCGMATNEQASTPTPSIEEPYDYYKAIKEILDAVPLPEIPENVSYEQCGQLCSNLKTGYHGQLAQQCRVYESEFRKHGYGTSACESSAYQRMSTCWSDSCGLIRILAGPTDGSVGAILQLDEIEETTGIPLNDLVDREPSIDWDWERLLEDARMKQNIEWEWLSEGAGGMGGLGVGTVDYIYYNARTGRPTGKLPERRFYERKYVNDEHKYVYIPVKDESVGPGGIVIQTDPLTSLDTESEALRRLVEEDRAFQLEILRGKIEIITGGLEKVKLHVPQGEIANDGTHFWVQVTDEGHTIVGVYEGEVKLTSLVTGETQTLGTNSEKPAIAGIRFISSEELGFIPEQEQKGNVFLWILIIAAFGGGVFILYKTGKLRQMLQKVLALAQNNNSKSP